jgi:uncharacterized protein (TIGR01319 family)
VIGGKHLSKRADFTAMVRGATPDVVLSAVELLARGLDEERPGAGDVVVVDVGGATTDVHSVVELDPEDAGLAGEVVTTTAVTRSVEGDLGMRWSATSTADAGIAGGLVEDAEALRGWARERQADPSSVPADDTGREKDRELATAAVGVALRRHAGRSQVVFGPDGRLVERTGKDLRPVDVLVGSGGVLRHGGHGTQVLLDAVRDRGGGWQLPEQPRVVVDSDYVLAAAGLLAGSYPDAAYALLSELRSPREAANP